MEFLGSGKSRRVSFSRRASETRPLTSRRVYPHLHNKARLPSVSHVSLLFSTPSAAPRHVPERGRVRGARRKRPVRRPTKSSTRPRENGARKASGITELSIISAANQMRASPPAGRQFLPVACLSAWPAARVFARPTSARDPRPRGAGRDARDFSKVKSRNAPLSRGFSALVA